MGSDMATSQDFVTWTCGPLLEPRFLLLCLRAMRRDLLERLAQGSTHKTIYMPDIESIRVPLAGQGAGWVRQLPDGVWEIVLPERGELEPFLQRLHAALPPPPIDE